MSGERTNFDRVATAGFLLSLYLRDHECDTEDETALTDMVADLMHFAAASDIDMDTVIDRARMHYDAEREGEG